MRIASRTGVLLLTLACIYGCRRRPATANGVIAVFGRLGLASGSFSYPRAVDTDANGAVFVVDKSGRVQRFSADGTFERVWRMPDTANGKPVGLTVGPDGRLFVADTHYHRVMVFDRDGHLQASFGSEGTGPGEFLLPTDVAIDADGYVYVSEYQGNDRITKWSPDFEFVKSMADTPIHGKRLSRPAAIDIDDQQTLWVADACNHRIVRLSREGDVLAVFGQFGTAPGQLRYPYDLAVSPDGTLLVCEYEGNRLHWFTKDGQSVRTWGRPGRAPGELFSPWGAAYGPHGRIYIVDSGNNRVQVLRPPS